MQFATADELSYVVSGVSDPVLSNVRLHLERFGFKGRTRISAGRFDELSADASERVREALKPYGYYQAEVSTTLVPVDAENWRMRVQISPGEPLRVAAANISITGAGADNGELRAWQRSWPLPVGAVVNQPRWEAQKKAALAAAEAEGFLLAHFTEQRIAVDLVTNEAKLDLVLDTGPLVLFGDIVFDQDILEPWVLDNVPRFDPGTPYNTELLEQLRIDLWRTGYFTDIEVREDRQFEQSPPVVNLRARLAGVTRNTYQGTLGFGTDTGVRLQGLWSRHRLSRRGDRLDIGTGYREFDNEFSLRADYRIPRRTEERQFWVASSAFRYDNQDLKFKREANDKGFVTLANGQVQDLNARFGRLHLRDRDEGFQQILETAYVELIRESFDYRPGSDSAPEVIALADDPRFAGLFRNTVSTVALGIEWDWPAVRGQAFETEGHRERAWLFTGNEAWGSERDFSQLYVSTRRSYLYGDRWKLLLRAELGYSDAKVREIDGSIDGEPFLLSVTQLPARYRFKAGGSNNVRGYGFEELSDNDIGSNNIVAASAEIEMKVAKSWSVAAFADIGNAFNDWSEAEPRKGVGFGVRWYSIAGAVRVDLAQALDIEGRPWRVHFTMGSPLL
ncbi:MAG: BamA/TamA family outer membrane protein [Halioglobus sp.]|nr:BamA/TamA family outer membrane protein [Halioglobus sp.]